LLPLHGEPEIKRPAAQLRALAADRDRLTARIAALEHEFDSLTDSIKRLAEVSAPATGSPQPTPSAPTTTQPALAEREAPKTTAASSPIKSPLAMPAVENDGRVGARPAAAASRRRRRRVKRTTYAEHAAPALEKMPLPPVRLAATAPAQLEFGIALAATSTIEVARLQWVAVKANSGRIIADLEPCALSGRRGAATHYQPVAGPLLSYTAAARLYERIIAAHAICQPVTYTGAPARPIVDTGAGYHNARDLFGSNMKLFLPSARATNFLLIIGFCSIGYALYLRYLVLEQSSVGLTCGFGLNTWLCFTRRIADVLFSHSVFGWTALAIAAVNLLRPSLVLFALALSIACFGVVLYNEGLSSIAVGLLLLSFARRAPEPN
jgi:hypothetical protein